MSTAERPNYAGSETEKRILEAFLRLAGQRGLDAITTRAIADAAGVNEVTLFRHFGDKSSLTRAAVRYASPLETFAAYPVRIDRSNPESVAQGLVACMVFLRQALRERMALLRMGLGESGRNAEFADEVKAAPRAGLTLLRRALAEARPCLRAEVDEEATALSLQGLVFLTEIWRANGWTDMVPSENEPGEDTLFFAAVRPLIDWRCGSETTEKGMGDDKDRDASRDDRSGD